MLQSTRKDLHSSGSILSSCVIELAGKWQRQFQAAPWYSGVGRKPFLQPKKLQQPLRKPSWLHSVLCGWSCISFFGKGDAPQASHREGEVFHTATWAAVERPPEAAASSPCPHPLAWAMTHPTGVSVSKDLFRPLLQMNLVFHRFNRKAQKKKSPSFSEDRILFKSASRPVVLNLWAMTSTWVSCLRYKS